MKISKQTINSINTKEYKGSSTSYALSNGNENCGCLCTILGIIFGPFGVLIAAVVDKANGVRAALFGWVLSWISVGLIILSIFGIGVYLDYQHQQKQAQIEAEVQAEYLKDLEEAEEAKRQEKIFERKNKYKRLNILYQECIATSNTYVRLYRNGFWKEAEAKKKRLFELQYEFDKLQHEISIEAQNK